MAVQVAQGQVVQVRRETPERWQKALQRALSLGLEVFAVADTGERFVTSASQLDTLHRSDGDSCTCKAGLAGDPVCCHRAAVRFIQGRLSDETEAARVACPECAGCGQQWYRGGFTLPCEPCGGTGVRVDRRLAGQPAVEIVAIAAA